MVELDNGAVQENQRIKEEWVSALIELNKQLKQWTVAQIKEWEKDPKQAVVPCVIETTTEKQEEYLGKYFAPALVITSEECEVVVRPVGRFAIGAIGQVCMTNNRQSINFLYSRKKGWLVMENRKPLTREMFLGLLEQMC
ncbi:MAG: hypothetical protein PHP51_02920 [Desulfotomaculaceae bacterium]|nr:hypothetical protein [Desulfotomaculaceae bacterium]MDD4766853.1 hypothetical protein [Desulfotomaculaceae bacterium]